MIVSEIVSSLQSLNELGRVIPLHALGRERVDTSMLLAALLGVQLPNSVYAVTRGGEKPEESVVYRPVSGGDTKIAGFPLFKSDVFVLRYRAKTVARLMQLVSGLSDLIEERESNSLASVIELTDVSSDYESSPQNNFVCNVELAITHLCGESQALPFVGVYLNSQRAEESSTVNRHVQHQKDSFGLVLVAPTAGMEAVQSAVELALIGRSINGSDGIQYQSGQLLEVVGHLSVWSDIYSVSKVVRG